MSEETPRVCATCGQDESDCPTRKGCHFPKYKNWIEPGIEKEENPTLFISYHFLAAYESGEMHEDFGNIFLGVPEPTNEETLQKVQDMISENIRIRTGFERSSVTVLNFKDLK